MDIINYFFLGLVQGIGEFLPISSSAHLYLYSYIFNLKYEGLCFDVLLHIATLLAIFMFFFSDIKKIIISAARDPKGKDFRFLFLIFIATIPGGIAGLLFEKQAEGIFRTPLVVSLSLIFFSILIFLIDRRKTGDKTEDSFDLKSAIIAGLFQSIAIVPGASRSAMTIIALLLMGYSRYASARISFFMAMPIIFGAGVLELRKLNLNEITIPFIVGFITAFISGILSIKFLLSYLKTKNLNLFIVYRILLGIFVLLKFFEIL